MGLAPAPDHPIAYGALMEIGYPSAVASIVSLADGTTSIYLGSGGGTIGAGAHAGPAQASRRFVAVAAQSLGALQPSQDLPLPAIGNVAFHVLTYDGGYTLEADEDELRSRGHPMSALYSAGHEVLTQIRLLEEMGSAER